MRNYTTGTFLTGWDTLHPEFNFSQQLSNIVFGVFRTDQGLGAVAAHSHMSELPRVLFLWLESLLLPLSFLRYSYVFLCFVLGPLGMYFLIKKVLSMQKHEHLTVFTTSAASFVGALIYIFNLGTIQQFYVPFEMFTTQYAALGWLFLTTIYVLEKRSLKHIFFLGLVSFLASSMAYAAVLWYAYFAALLSFLFVYVLLIRTRKVLISALLVVLVTLLVNAYWMLPNFYFLATSAKEVSLAQTNKIFSDEAFLHNKQYGTVQDTAILKNFLFNWTNQVDVNTSEDLLRNWKQHLSIPGVIFIGYAVFFLCLSGIALSIYKKSRLVIAFIPVWLLSFVMLMNMNPPFEPLFGYLRDNFSLFREGLRFPFTKFSLLLILTLSLFSAYAFEMLLRTLKRIPLRQVKTLYWQVALIVLVSLLLHFYGLPMFQGEFISKRMRITIPNEYFQLFSYMNSKDASARLAPLPVHSLWGWEYYDWGYQGAGFLWFGVKQPVLARDFDRWNPGNEQYYREISEALYSRDEKRVEAIARKYRIRYFLLDQNVIFPGNKQNALWHYETKQMFKDSKNIRLVKSFGNDLLLYEVSPSFSQQSYVQSPKTILSVGPLITGGFVDLASQTFGDYVSSDTPDYFYPARSLVNRYDRIDPQNIEVNKSDLTLKLTSIPDNYEFTTSWLDRDIFPEFVRTYNLDTSTEELSVPYLISQNPFVTIPIASSTPVLQDIIVKSDECGTETPTTASKMTLQGDFVRFASQKGASCAYANFPLAKQDFGSMLVVEARNTKGLPIRLCVTNNQTRRCDIYTTLDMGNEWKRYLFMIPPQPSGNSGYAVNFNTVSIGKDESINDIRLVNLIQIPYYRIENLYFVKDAEKTPLNNGVSVTQSTKTSPVEYVAQVKRVTSGDGLITFFESFDPGWTAYMFDKQYSLHNLLFPFTGTKLTNHTLINGWANGWIIPSTQIANGQTSPVIIVFIPQYLEYIGLVLLGGFFVSLTGVAVGKKAKTFKRHKKHNHA